MNPISVVSLVGNSLKLRMMKIEAPDISEEPSVEGSLENKEEILQYSLLSLD